jgi:hypothetical protein
VKTPLDYDPRMMPGLRRRRRRNIIGLVAVVLLLGSWAAYATLRPIWPGIKAWWSFKQAEDFLFPVGQLVFDCRPDAIAGVDFSDPEAATLPFTYVAVRSGFAQQTIAAQAAVRVPAVWAALPLDRGRSGLVFVHGQKTPAGHPFVVDVQVEDVGELALTTRVITPAKMNEPPRVFNQNAMRVRVSDIQKLQIFAGQPDAKDPTRFTIDYSIDGKRGMIEGKLDDLGQLTLTPDGGRIERGGKAADRWIVDP